MGLDAQVIAIGPFSKSLESALDYPSKYYVDVKEGSKVICRVFEALTSAQSHQLARAFGVGPMELGNHDLSTAAANLELLVELFDEENVSRFKRLVQRIKKEFIQVKEVDVKAKVKAPGDAPQPGRDCFEFDYPRKVILKVVLHKSGRNGRRSGQEVWVQL